MRRQKLKKIASEIKFHQTFIKVTDREIFYMNLQKFQILKKKFAKCNQKFSLFSRNVSFAGHPSYNKHTDPTKLYNAWLICLPETRLKEAFNICHEGITSGHRGVASM